MRGTGWAASPRGSSLPGKGVLGAPLSTCPGSVILGCVGGFCPDQGWGKGREQGEPWAQGSAVPSVCSHHHGAQAPGHG